MAEYHSWREFSDDIVAAIRRGAVERLRRWTANVDAVDVDLLFFGATHDADAATYGMAVLSLVEFVRRGNNEDFLALAMMVGIPPEQVAVLWEEACRRLDIAP